MHNKNEKITTFDIDILTEIGNIGAGNAVSALSEILNQSIGLEITMAEICDLSDIPDILGGEEAVRTAVFTKISNALEGYIFFILRDEDADYICDVAGKGYDIDKNSILNEITNIITGAYIGAIGNMIDGVIDQTPPHIGHDMIGALIDSILAFLLSTADKSLIIGTNLKIQGESISGFYGMLLEQKSLITLLEKFNSYRK